MEFNPSRYFVIRECPTFGRVQGGKGHFGNEHRARGVISHSGIPIAIMYDAFSGSVLDVSDTGDEQLWFLFVRNSHINKRGESLNYKVNHMKL